MKALKKYLKSRKINIDFLLGKPKRNFTPATFHKLRIELKKLNGFLELINYCSKGFRKKKTFKPFRRIFKQAGKVRELQLQAGMIKKYFPENTVPKYKADLNKIQLEETRAFFSLFDPKLFTEMKGKFDEIKSFLPKIKAKTTINYLESEAVQIKNLTDKNPVQKKHLHQLRKRLKKMNNNLDSLNLKKNKVLNSKKNDLPRLLGDWHDLQVMIDHLNMALEDNGINPDEAIQLENLKTILSAESEILSIQVNISISESEFIDKLS